MNFEEFVAALPDVRRRHPHAVDLTETRVTRGLADLAFSAQDGLSLPANGYRCHVAQAWFQRLNGLAPALSSVLVSRGVRHSMAVLFRSWASAGTPVTLPSDVYPVYLSLAHSAGLTFGTYVSHPWCDFAEARDSKVLLIANPLKPRGDRLSAAELRALLDWLSTDSERRVVVDAVYDLEAGLARETQVLFETGQAIVLHSLSKAWLAPLRAGAVVLPSQDVEKWTPVFRGEAVDRAGLAQAEALMREQGGLPGLVADEVAAQTARLRELVSARGLALTDATGPSVPSYLHRVPVGFEAVLERGLIGLPMSVFGGHDSNATVLSALSA